MSSLINKAKDAMSGSGSSSGAGQPAGQKEDYVDKGLDAGEKKFGMHQSRETNEKITDTGRGLYEKQTGKKVSDKVHINSPFIHQYEDSGLTMCTDQQLGAKSFIHATQ